MTGADVVPLGLAKRLDGVEFEKIEHLFDKRDL
jgi:hypothetical protein